MALSLGTDLIEIARVRQALARHGDALLARLFTARERDLMTDHPGEIARVAARFAAKEAALKALGTGWGQGVGWHHVEVLGGRGGPPTLELNGPAAERQLELGLSRVAVSLTHTGSLAGATVVMS